MSDLKLPKISISLRKDNKNDKGFCPLNYFILFNGKTIKKTVGESIKEKEWNFKKKEVNGDSVRLKTIQKKFRDKMSEFETEIYNLSYNKKPITRKVIDDFFEKKKVTDFYTYYLNYVEYLTGLNRAKSTLGKYKNTLKVFKTYLKNRKELAFDDLTDKLILDFDKYLISKNLFINTIYNYHKNVRTVLKSAFDEGTIASSPYFRFRPKKIEPLKPRIPLTKSEQTRIENLKFEDKDKDLIIIKDYFLFYCNTGCRFSEIFTIKKGNVTRETFTHIDCKSKKSIVKFLNEKSWKLIVKYRAKSETEFVFEKLNNSDFNAKLKRIQKLAKIDKNLISHLGRHTMATNLRREGTTLEDIGAILGQKRIDTTMIYSKPNAENLYKAVNNM